MVTISYNEPVVVLDARCNVLGLEDREAFLGPALPDPFSSDEEIEAKSQAILAGAQEKYGFPVALYRNVIPIRDGEESELIAKALNEGDICKLRFRATAPVRLPMDNGEFHTFYLQEPFSYDILVNNKTVVACRMFH
jgi:hypothetical protein